MHIQICCNLLFLIRFYNEWIEKHEVLYTITKQFIRQTKIIYFFAHRNIENLVSPWWVTLECCSLPKARENYPQTVEKCFITESLFSRWLSYELCCVEVVVMSYFLGGESLTWRRNSTLIIDWEHQRKEQRKSILASKENCEALFYAFSIFDYANIK